jgi:RNA polymerase sigma-70 factor (ECF subfamily)
MLRPGGNRFPTTQWTLVLSAGSEADPQSRDALAALCSSYWYPIYAYIRRRGSSAQDAQDLTQEFFTRVVEKRYMDRADPQKGRFRQFLLMCVNHFLSDAWDRSQAQKRGGPMGPEPAWCEALYGQEPADTETPELIFERRWALILIERALDGVRAEFVAEGRGADFEKLRGFLAEAGEGSSYAETAAAMGVKLEALRVTVHRMRRRYRDRLRSEIAQTVAAPEEVEPEIRYLLGILASRRGSPNFA